MKTKKYIKPEIEVVSLETFDGIMMQMSANGMQDASSVEEGSSRPKDNFWGS